MKLLYLGNMLSNHGKTPTTIETLGKQFEEIAVVYRFSDKINPVLRMLDMVRACVRMRKNIDFAIIDTYSNWAFYYAFFCGIILKFFGVQYIPILHGGNLPLRLRQSPSLSSIIFNNAYINIAPSGYLFEHFKTAGFSVEMIPNYIEIAEYPFKYRKEIKPTILWVRSFNKIYQPEMAILMMEKLVRVYPNAHLCMVGPDKDGSMEQCKRIIKEKNLCDNVKITGKLSKSEWISLSKDYDVFLNTTSVDNTPVSVMEALALGMVLVSSKVGGIPWLFEDGREGIMVENADPDKFAKVIIDLIEDPTKAANLSLYARRKSESWDWVNVKNKWEGILNTN
jgi:glycosyltransferase involved in cell wall biosynthesis